MKAQWSAFYIKLMKSTKYFLSDSTIKRSLIWLCFSLIFIFSFFRVVDNRIKENLKVSIETLLRNEQLSTNPYNLAKLISDLEFLKTLECVTLIQRQTSEVKYYDTSSLANCPDPNKDNYLALDFTSINGSSYQLRYIHPQNIFLTLFETTSYLMSLVFCFLYFRVGKNEFLINSLKIQNAIKQAEAIENISKQVAHDIRSPLSALTIAVKNIRQSPEESKKIIDSAVKRINDVANDLLKGKIEVNYINKTSVNAVVESIVSEASTAYAHSLGIRITFDIPQDREVFVDISANDLSRILSNLINNAIEALNNYQGSVAIYVRRYGKDASIVVQDDGRGISEAILAKLGEKGMTYGKSMMKSGSGLGLYHAKSTLSKHGGKLQIISTEGIGTQITITLPISAD